MADVDRSNPYWWWAAMPSACNGSPTMSPAIGRTRKSPPLPAGEPAAVARLITERTPDAVILQADFADEAAASTGLKIWRRCCTSSPALYCILLAEQRQRTVGGQGPEERRQGLPAARAHHPGSIAGGHHAKPAPSAARPPQAAKVAESVPAADAPAIRVPGYSIVKEIATSNFSQVFLARSERLRRNVVLKVMNRGDPRRAKSTMPSASSASTRSSPASAHRAIAEIYDFGALPQHLYLAMEYFPCGDLRDRLRNPMSVDESLYYLRAIAEALRVIHVFGILHRDLKPANVMLREDNSPVLIDFGLARRSMDDAGTTGVGQVLGSPYYISPEQSQGQRVDARTDLYSLGVMFYEMLTGQRPYAGSSALAIMEQHANAPVPRLPDNVALQQALVDRFMAKQPVRPLRLGRRAAGRFGAPGRRRRLIA